MVVSRAEIFDHDSARIFDCGEAAHDRWRFDQRRKLPVKLDFAVLNFKWRFDDNVSREVCRCFSRISDLQKDELGDRSLEFKING